MTETFSAQIIRGPESWQFFAFAFAAIVALAFTLTDELPKAVSKGRRALIKFACFCVVGYFTLLNDTGRNFLVGVLKVFKELESR